jgi:hypothetical protein
MHEHVPQLVCDGEPKTAIVGGDTVVDNDAFVFDKRSAKDSVAKPAQVFHAQLETKWVLDPLLDRNRKRDLELTELIQTDFERVCRDAFGSRCRGSRVQEWRRL